MPHNTRLNIIRILERRKTSSARDLSRLLKVTAANVRHHLSVLIEEGSIEFVGYEENQGRGRPTAIYALTKSPFTDNLNILSEILLHDLLDDKSPTEKEDVLRWLAKRICTGISLTSSNPTQRLYSSIGTLNKLNYHAHWEAHADTPLIMFGNCPYRAILDEYPEMCVMDTYLIEYLTGNHTDLLAKLMSTPDHRHQCVFRIGSK